MEVEICKVCYDSSEKGKEYITWNREDSAGEQKYGKKMRDLK